jgi:hypothetical protein
MQLLEVNAKIAELNVFEIKRYITLLEKLELPAIEIELNKPKIKSLCQQNPVFNEAIFCMLLSK